MTKTLALENKISEKELETDSEMLRMFYLFSFQCQGVFNPLCAFMGALVSQECIKAITHKFTPTMQLFYYDSTEVLPAFDVAKDITSLKAGESFVE
jgi:hypothetical protein